MTNKTFKGIVAFTTILTTAACAFAGVTNLKQLENVRWNQSSPWEDYLPSTATSTVKSGCVPTAYSQLMAYHEWPAIIDDTVIGYAAVGNESGLYISRIDFNTPVYTKIDWEAMKRSPTSTRGRFENGRLITVLGAYSFPVYDDTETKSTVSCPHYNPWYGGLEYHSNPKQGETNWQAQRKELFDAIKRSIEVGLPSCAGFMPAHAVVVEGYREEDGVPSVFCNMGWGGRGETWASSSTDPVGKVNALSAVFAMHAPRKVVQVEPLPAVSGTSPTIRWYAPKYWKEIAPESDRITGYKVEVSEASNQPMTWSDDFSKLKQDYLLRNMCGGSDNDDHEDSHERVMIKVENNELWILNCADPRYYEWPESWVATEDSKLTFRANIGWTFEMDGLIQIKVANQPWQTLFDLAEGEATAEREQGWKDYDIPLGKYSGQAFKLRIYTARRQRGGYLNYASWKFANWSLSNVHTFGNATTYDVPKTDFEKTLKLTDGKIYEIAVKPVLNGKVEQCHRTTTTRVKESAPEANAIAVTYREKEPVDGLEFECAHTQPSVLTVKTAQEVSTLTAISGNTAIFPTDAITVKKVDATTWKVILTPTEDFMTHKKTSNGQRLLLTLAAIDANGTAAYKDLSIVFLTSANVKMPNGGESVSFVESDFTLPKAGADEWIFTITQTVEPGDWDELVFTRADGATRRGRDLPTDAKVRIIMADPVVPKSYWDYKSIGFPSDRKVFLDTLTIEKSETSAPLRLKGAVRAVLCLNFNVGAADVRHEGVVQADALWIGYECKLVTAGGYLDCFKTLAGTGTIEFLQNQPPNGFDAVDHSKFYGYVAGTLVEEPAIDPDPDLIGKGGATEEDSESGSTGEVLNTKAQDPVKSITQKYGYDMTENYWDARKQAIQTGKLLFVLSGSDSCNWCHEAMVYLEKQSAKINPKYVVYYARRQNGDVPMRGGLPQYGSYDPRTIDAFTGCYDENGNFNPATAWYSGHDHAFASERSYSVPQIDRVIAAPGDTKIGNFVNFELNAPKAVIANTPTQLTLYAIFDDEVKMAVDYGVEWLVTEGDATITKEGVLTAKSNGIVKVSARNAFYNFNAKENTLEATMNVVSLSEISGMEITSESFNLEDNPDVRLKAVAILNDGTTTDASPVWTAKIKSFFPLPEGAPLYQRQYGAVTVNKNVNGQIFYLHDEVYDGINLQDHLLEVSAELGGKIVTKEIKVYGPTRIWVTDWELITPETVAPGSVVRAKVNKMKYTYAGNVHETSDTNYATFTTGYVKDMTGYSIKNSTSIEFVPSYDSRYKDGEQIKIRIEAQKKGGKYSGTDYDTMNEAVSTRKVTFRQSSTYYTSKNDIKVNEAWLKIYYPNRTDFAKLVDEDTDEDGFTTAEEFILGTDPTKQADRWAFTSSHFDWPNEIYYRVMFMSHTFSGRVYTIEGAVNLDSDTWYTLGTLNTRRDNWMADEDIKKADDCRVFRVKVKFGDENYTSGEFVIPGYGVWNGVTLNPKEGEKYAAFIVDANNLTYKLPVNFSKSQNLDKPVFSVPTEQVMLGTLDRFEPSVSLKDEGYRFVRKENGIWTAFYAVKGVKSWEEVSGVTDMDAIPGLKPADASALKKAARAPTKLAEWARGRGKVSLGSEINLDCFILNAANGEKTPELTIDADDLKAILSGDHSTIKAKYPNAKVEVKDVTEEICGSTASGVKLFTLVLSL